MFHRSQVPTNINLGKLVSTGDWISRQLLQATGSRAGSAMAVRVRRCLGLIYVRARTGLSE
jgi:hydroxymethylglutaryl-CoA lyase